jgi:hypothetical protein
MSEQTTQTANNPAVFKILDDGTVLYKTSDQAEAARLQQKASQQQSGTTVKKLSQVKSGELYLAKDGKAAPYTLGSLVEFQVTGLIVVIVVLAGLSLICAAIGRLIKSLEKSVPAALPPPVMAPPAAPAAAVTSGIHPGLTDQQLVVLLTAAASAMLGGPVRVDKFRPLTAKDLNWAVQGRSDLQYHRLK